MSIARLFLFPFAFFAATAASAQSLAPRSGWEVHTSSKPYVQLIANLKSAVKAEGLVVVTQAGPTKAAANRGIVIPGNRVIGVFNNDYAVKILETSTAAMIEAPIRFYVTEESDGGATLSYKTPSHVFAPYMEEGGPVLSDLASTLDASFAAIAEAAVR